MQKIGAEHGQEALSLSTAEVQAADQPFLPRERQQRHTLERRERRKEQPVVRGAESAEPWAPARRNGWRNAMHRIDEQNVAVLPAMPTLRRQQTADLMIGIGNDERRRFEPIARPHSGGEPLEQSIERVGLEQLHLAGLRSAPRFVVLARFVG
ncbi:MAG TPA: hypothetical protein VF405_15055 [Gammaproteobacteria bacterium]